jgi:hypothetical protein
MYIYFTCKVKCKCNKNVHWRIIEKNKKNLIQIVICGFAVASKQQWL